MEVDVGEQVAEVTDVTENSETHTEEVAAPQNKSRGRGFRGQGKGGRMGRGGRGARGLMTKVFGPPGRGRSRSHHGFMNGFGPIRMGLERPLPYPDMHGRKGTRGRPIRMGRPPLPPPMCFRRPHPPMHRHGLPPPPGHPGFRGFPLPPRRRGMMPPCSPHLIRPRGGT
ncbi:uncharacterized protein LOC143514379 isoform X2 [Brachyhypopomus gauderio]|uniref:uncharacterized protein LOC143514379 isoform X2 n=1 Tax=Brachyhypopomus gauderio TaxID=698409 RepID=UPI0040424770